MVPGAWPSQLDDTVSFRRSKQGFRYLGIILTPQVTQLYQANYKKIIGTFRDELARGDMLPLSLLGRVETVKMNLLPRILFLFQSLQVGITTSTFILLDKLMSKFIWQNKKPRVRLKTLTLGKDRGGLSLPNLKHYFWGTQLTAVVACINNDVESGWVHMHISKTNSVFPKVICFGIFR